MYDWGLTDAELGEELRGLLLRSRPRHRRFANACEMVARTLALREAVDFAEHRHRLLTQATGIIAARPGLARWRFN